MWTTEGSRGPAANRKALRRPQLLETVTRIVETDVFLEEPEDPRSGGHRYKKFLKHCYTIPIAGAPPGEVGAEMDIPDGFRVRGFDVYLATGPEGGGIDEPSPPAVVTLWTVDGVNPDPCRGSSVSGLQEYRDPGPGVEQLTRMLSRQPGRVGAAPTPTTLAGFSGRYLELRFPEGFDPSACATGRYEAWVAVDPITRGRTERDWYGADTVDRIWILDVEGTRVIVNPYHDERSFDDQRAVLDAMLDSLEIHSGGAD